MKTPEWAAEYIVCPYCNCSNVDERVTGWALCNECFHLSKVESITLYKATIPTKDDDERSKVKIELQGFGFPVV